MEGEKERQWHERDKKENNDPEVNGRSDGSADNEEDNAESSELAALVWQEGYDRDNLSHPITHWEALNLRIAELEKQEEEKKEKMTKNEVYMERCRAPASCTEVTGRKGESWEDRDDTCNTHILALTSRLQTQMNLQLCFINDSESEEEEEDEDKHGELSEKESSNTQKGSVQVPKNHQPHAKKEKTKFSSFRNTLRNLRNRLRIDHKTLTTACSDLDFQRRHLERIDLQNFSIKDLNVLITSLSQAIQDLNSELVGCLQLRDQLRTEQDAMLLEVQDLTSL